MKQAKADYLNYINTLTSIVTAACAVLAIYWGSDKANEYISIQKYDYCSATAIPMPYLYDHIQLYLNSNEGITQESLQEDFHNYFGKMQLLNSDIPILYNQLDSFYKLVKNKQIGKDKISQYLKNIQSNAHESCRSQFGD